MKNKTGSTINSTITLIPLLDDPLLNMTRSSRALQE